MALSCNYEFHPNDTGLIIAYYANIVSKKILIQIGNTKY